MSHKFKLSLHIFILCTVAATLILISAVAFAQENDRDTVIQRELDCIAKAHENDKNYSWTDLCYTDSSESVADENTAVSISADDDTPQFIKTKFEVLTGYRMDDLKWNIAGTLAGTNPNIISELTWDNIQSAQIQGTGEVVLLDHFVFEGSAGYARIFAGDNQDSDYNSDNRVDEFSRSNNGADKGTMNDYSGGIGYRVNFQEFFDLGTVEHLSFTPLAGYAYNAQNLRMTDGYQTLASIGTPPIGPIEGLNSTYETQWDGPWYGAELSAKAQKITGTIRFEYHISDFTADANWNLRSDLGHPKSFEHTADGSGYVIKAGLGYELSPNWNLKLGFDYYNYETDPGVIRFILADGSEAKQRLNVVYWDSFSFNAGLVCLF